MWYIHTHQIKKYAKDDGRSSWRKLRPNRLTLGLLNTFRSYYPTRQHRKHPHRPNQTNLNHSDRNGPSGEQLPKTNNVGQIAAKNPVPPPTGFPLPMQAPQPWTSPTYPPKESILKNSPRGPFGLRASPLSCVIFGFLCFPLGASLTYCGGWGVFSQAGLSTKICFTLLSLEQCV